MTCADGIALCCSAERRLIHDVVVDHEFIVKEKEERNAEPSTGELTGWESIVFEVADAEEEEE